MRICSAGENALFCWNDEGGIETIEEQTEFAIASGADVAGLTALRLEPWLVGPICQKRLLRLEFHLIVSYDDSSASDHQVK